MDFSKLSSLARTHWQVGDICHSTGPLLSGSRQLVALQVNLKCGPTAAHCKQMRFTDFQTLKIS